uniref:NADP-dependent oxidoreductase domain-containing protein n=1 Tax=Globisporangium ultimum (strain ATCC 200006 / CBS 805.95 / DAOM BR144) TaxID=431595 RepID=K3X3C3_GLOUD
MASPTMKYRHLGNTGLLVSTLSLGCMTFDDKFGLDKTYAIMTKAYGAGVNYFDNAEAYGLGKSEEVVGQAIQKGIQNGVWSREDLVVSTKLFVGTTANPSPNSLGLNRKHIIEGIKASLRRLQLDYVDVLFCHRPDSSTPIEETVRAMNFVIEQGWAFYWGTSEWKSGDIIEACDVADRLGLVRPVVEQPQYNIFERSRVEFDFVNLYKKYGLGLTTFSPLRHGLISGKHTTGFVQGTRLTVPWIQNMVPDLELKIAKAEKMKVIAEDLGCSLPQLAIAWCASNPIVSTVMLGATSVDQLDENLKAYAFVDKITPEVKARIDEIAQFVPQHPAYDNHYTSREKFL